MNQKEFNGDAVLLLIGFLSLNSPPPQLTSTLSFSTSLYLSLSLILSLHDIYLPICGASHLGYNMCVLRSFGNKKLPEIFAAASFGCPSMKILYIFVRSYNTIPLLVYISTFADACVAHRGDASRK
jgi:hypothetical protein